MLNHPIDCVKLLFFFIESSFLLVGMIQINWKRKSILGILHIWYLINKRKHILGILHKVFYKYGIYNLSNQSIVIVHTNTPPQVNANRSRMYNLSSKLQKFLLDEAFVSISTNWSSDLAMKKNMVANEGLLQLGNWLLIEGIWLPICLGVNRKLRLY